MESSYLCSANVSRYVFSEPFLFSINLRRRHKTCHRSVLHQRHVLWPSAYPRIANADSKYEQMLSSYPTGEDFLTAFRLTMMADTTSNKELARMDPGSEADFAAYVHYSPFLSTLSKDDRQRLLSISPQGNVRRYLHAVKTASHARCVFITRLGFIGLCPRYTKLEDRVCILLGGDIPYILRQEEESMRFVEACYAYGLMNGNAIETGRRHHYPMEVINIR